MSKQYVISIMTSDRVGIVADVTTAIMELNGNLADLSQTVLRGYFTMIVIASFPDTVDPDRIRAALHAIDNTDPFEVGIKTPNVPLEEELREYGKDHYVLTAVGPDEIGLVAAVSTYLRNHGINIDDLTTRVDDGRYTMILSIELTSGTDIASFKTDMTAAMRDIGVTVELQHHNIFRALNEV